MALACAGVAVLAQPAHAQQPTQTTADVISFLVTNQSVVTEDFQKDQAAAAATSDTISRAVLVNLATVPIPTSSSGFVYRLDPALGTMIRASDSFGTFYVERAMTGGRNRLSLGASGTSASYDRLDGLHLRDGSLVTTANQFRDEAAPFDVESLTLKIRTQTLTVFGSYGVTDRLEIGGAVPLVQLHLEGSRTNFYRGQQFLQASGSADASGLADVAVRAKYALLSTAGGAIAAAVEWRLPTGDAKNLLGAGTQAVRVLGIGSIESGRVGLHGNAGVVRGGVSDEWLAAGGLTVAVSPHVTLSGETSYRRLSELHDIVAVTAPHPTITGVDTLRLLPGTSTASQSSLVTGAKWNLANALVLSGQMQWRLGSGGLTSAWAPSVSLDYLF